MLRSESLRKGNNQFYPKLISIENKLYFIQIRYSTFDTCAVNAGHLKGALVYLEKKIGRKILHCACRHHVMELPLAAIFKYIFGNTIAPEMTYFLSFKKEWNTVG